MTPLQKQALFTLRQALDLCYASGLRIIATEHSQQVDIEFIKPGDVETADWFNRFDVDLFERENGDD